MKQNTQESKKNTKKTGDLGESLAMQYLKKRGFNILEQNYWKKYGEIDIVAKKDNVVHFIEVKTVSYETKAALERSVTHETWRPEEQVHQFKLRQIHKALETWLMERNWEGEWQIDVLGVRIVPRETYCSVNQIKNVI